MSRFRRLLLRPGCRRRRHRRQRARAGADAHGRRTGRAGRGVSAVINRNSKGRTRKSPPRLFFRHTIRHTRTNHRVLSERFRVPISKKIVCLATSQKIGGRCVAGKEITAGGFGGWIRPVSSRPSAEVSLEERHYQDGTEPALLDTILIPVIGKSAAGHQSENITIDARYYWQRTGKLAFGDLSNLLDTPKTLWQNGNSTYNGENDRVTIAEASSLRGSLYLIQPTNISLRVFQPGIAFGDLKRTVRASFTYNAESYDFSVTDLDVRQRFLLVKTELMKLKGPSIFVSVSHPHIMMAIATN